MKNLPEPDAQTRWTEFIAKFTERQLLGLQLLIIHRLLDIAEQKGNK